MMRLMEMSNEAQTFMHDCQGPVTSVSCNYSVFQNIRLQYCKNKPSPTIGTKGKVSTQAGTELQLGVI